MLPERISVKFFVSDGEVVEPAALIPLFHRWIREQRLPGLPIDVADYKHVPEGPGVLLMGHEADYAWDGRYHRPGLLYKHKREWPGDSLPERLRHALERASVALALVQEAPELHGVAFRADELEIAFPDRLHVPNTSETLAELREGVTAVLQAHYPDKDIVLTHVHTEARRPFTLNVSLVPIHQLVEA
ncbi:MAG: hypothetical protein IPM53_32320 [Anaerolineaceae bacterium]|nr:hypothetical protein [Anaerolineaceae bacterium]